MAITFRGTKNSLPASQLPDDYVKPDVEAVNDYEYHRVLELSVAKATVENADAATTMDNILDDAAVGLNKQLTDIITAEFVGTEDVVAHADLLSLRSNFSPLKKDSPGLTDAAAAFVATVSLYIKST